MVVGHGVSFSNFLTCLKLIVGILIMVIAISQIGLKTHLITVINQNIKMRNEDLIKLYPEEIKIIHEVIKRMASNSFQLKGWTVTLVTVTLIFKAVESTRFALLLAYIPLFVFWYLDGYYLRQERLFRELYKWVVANRLADGENTRKLFDLDTSTFQKTVSNTYVLMLSKSIAPFYACIVILISVFVPLICNGIK